MDAVFFGLLAGALAGASNVALYVGLRQHPDVEAASLTMTWVGLVAVAIIAVALGRDLGSWDQIWPFLLIGLLVPGLSTVMFVAGMIRTGASRTAVLANTFPLYAALLAVGLLGESLRLGLALGTALVVVGAVGLAMSGSPPSIGHGRRFRVGMVAAFLAAFTIAGRDTLVRWVGAGDDLSPIVANGVTLASGSVALAAFLVVMSSPREAVTRARTATLPFALVGVLTGVTTIAIFEALERGRVTVVSPLIGTAGLWTLAFSVIVLRGHEGIGRRVALSALLVAGGAALIGVSRGAN